jgi:ribonuclease D
MNEQKLEINKAEVNLLPLWRYEGTVVMLESDEDAQAAAARMSEAAYVGIDTETKPTFRKGATQRPVALLQLALPDVVYLLRLNHYGLFDSIRAVLESESVEKIGIGTRDDVRELQRDFGCNLRGVVDLNTLCTQLGFKSIGARKLTALILGRRISKSQQTSDWEKPALTTAQIAYAATDAWVCQAMYAQLPSDGLKPRRKRRRRRRRSARSSPSADGSTPSDNT